MKNIRKVSAMLMATVMTAGAVSSMTAGAIGWEWTKDGFDKIIEEAYMIPVDGFLQNNASEWYKNERTYLVETEDNVYNFYKINGAYPDRISAKVDADIDCDAVETAIAEICPDADYINITDNVDSIDIIVAGLDITESPRYHTYADIRQKDVTYEQAVKIYEMLNSTGKLQSYVYTQKPVFYGTAGGKLTTYLNVGFDGLHYLELIENYITENDLDWYIEKDSETFDVTTGQRLSAEENYKIAEQIYNDLGIYPLIIYPESASLSEDITIEMHDKIDGDANNDGELTLADAIVTLQSVGNPEKYGVNGWDDTHITYQGSFNADIAGDYDGITSADALAIQRKVLGLE